MTANYISEMQNPYEVFRLFGDQVPEFMQTWLEQIVNKAQDAEDIYEVIYMNSELDLESATFKEDFVEMADKASEYNSNKEEIIDLKQQVKDLESEVRHLEGLLNDNDIEY